MALVIWESKDAAGNRWAWADYMGFEDSNSGICESVIWIDGDYKAQVEAAAIRPIPHKSRGPGGYKTMRLEGGLPVGDQQYNWSDQPGVDFRKVT